MTPSTYKFLTEALVIFHFAFVAFVVTGGLIVLRFRRVAWLHVPAVIWVIYAEATGTLCPLTPLENQLRVAANLSTYDGGFVNNYIMPVLYPQGLTPAIQVRIAIGLLVVNGICYSLILAGWRRRRRRRAVQTSTIAPIDADALSQIRQSPADQLAVSSSTKRVVTDSRLTASRAVGSVFSTTQILREPSTSTSDNSAML